MTTAGGTYQHIWKFKEMKTSKYWCCGQPGFWSAAPQQPFFHRSMCRCADPAGWLVERLASCRCSWSPFISTRLPSPANAMQAPWVPVDEALVHTGHGMCGRMKSWNLECGLGGAGRSPTSGLIGKQRILVIPQLDSWPLAERGNQESNLNFRIKSWSLYQRKTADNCWQHFSTDPYITCKQRNLGGWVNWATGSFLPRNQQNPVIGSTQRFWLGLWRSCWGKSDSSMTTRIL